MVKAKKTEKEDAPDFTTPKSEETGLIKKDQTTSGEIATLDKNLLAEDAAIGMSRIDVKDVRPSQVLIVQKSSDLTAMKDEDGQKPDFGQYFNTGKMEILDSFECYILYAAKVPWFDKRAKDPSKANKMKYQTIGMMADDHTLFSMDFKSGAMYSLTPLFSVAATNKRPFWTIKAKLDKTKILSNKDGEWASPVVRVVDYVDDLALYNELKAYAKQFDKMGGAPAAEEPEEADEFADIRKPDTAAPTEEELKAGSKEDVKAEDIPF